LQSRKTRLKLKTPNGEQTLIAVCNRAATKSVHRSPEVLITRAGVDRRQRVTAALLRSAALTSGAKLDRSSGADYDSKPLVQFVGELIGSFSSVTSAFVNVDALPSVGWVRAELLCGPEGA
jgi:hypothetical protein